MLLQMFRETEVKNCRPKAKQRVLSRIKSPGKDTLALWRRLTMTFICYFCTSYNKLVVVWNIFENGDIAL